MIGKFDESEFFRLLRGRLGERTSRLVASSGVAGFIWAQSNDAVDLLTVEEKKTSFTALAKAFAGSPVYVTLGCQGRDTADMETLAALLRVCTPTKASVFLHANGQPMLKPGELAKDATHSPAFSDRFNAIATSRGVASRWGSRDEFLQILKTSK